MSRTPAGLGREAGIPQLQQALAEGRVSSREWVQDCLRRIASEGRAINAVASVNPRALDEAAALDREREAGRLRGPLHGLPIALKDNIAAAGMPTTGGAVAFVGLVPPAEATLARVLRERGAVIVAKTVMTELANWVARLPTTMPANYSALFGHAWNPYDPRRDPRPGFDDGRGALPTGGSSSGGGTAAGLWLANVGTETSGSILSPAQQTMLVGIKPTVGRISRHGIIPITADQDTAGPMARTVTDAAILLGELERSAPDPRDAATGHARRPPVHDYRPFLQRSALRGARIGVPRAFFLDPFAAPGDERPRGGLDAEAARRMDEALAVLRREGATVVDPADIPSVVDLDPARNFLRAPIATALGEGSGSIVLAYGMKRDFESWLASLGGRAPVANLAELRRFNREQATTRGTLRYGQGLLDGSDAIDLQRDRGRYEADRARDLWLCGTHGIDAVLARHRLDAVLFPGASGANLCARAGHPSVIVPFGFVTLNPTPGWPDGFRAPLAPFGIAFAGAPHSEPRLIALAYAFEQATRARVPPVIAPLD